MLSRRQFLVGAGATGSVAAAAGGGYTATHLHQVRRFLHGRGLLGGPDHGIPVVDAPVAFGQLPSSAPGGGAGYGVYRPASPARAVVVALHGRGGSHRDPFESIGLHAFVAEQQLPWIVAACDGGESFWHARADGTDTQHLVADELVPLVSGAAPLPVAVIGWSMGGYGALLFAQQRDVFVAVVASSPSIWRSFSEAAAGAFDDATDFARNDVLANARALDGNALRVDCGEDDVFAGVTREVLRVTGAHGGVHDGYHESPTWRSFVPAQLEFLKTRLPV